MTLDDFLKLPGAKVHDGSGCPVGSETRVIVMQRSGEVRYEREASHWCSRAGYPEWGRDCWQHAQDPHLTNARIIAYREAP